MARPAKKAIVTAEAWDAAVNDNFDSIFDTPIPLARYADVPSLPNANLYDGCIAEVDGEGLVISENGAWVRLAKQGAQVSDVGSLTSVVSFEEVDVHLGTLQAKIDELLAALRTSYALST